MATRVATPRSRALGLGLRTAREARKLGVRALARIVDIAPQDLSHWESGVRIPKPEQVAALLGLLRVRASERERLVDLARNAREPNWLEPASPALATYLEYERTASAMFNWEPFLVPGLLQTPDYARAILNAHRLPERAVENQVAIRLRRREALTRPDPLLCMVLLGESALRQGIGGPAVMAEQLQFLVRAAQRRSLTLRIMPANVGYHPGLMGHFVIFDFLQLPSVVHIEHVRGSAHVYDGDHVVAYRAAAEAMLALAMSEQDSRTFVQGVIAELE